MSQQYGPQNRLPRLAWPASTPVRLVGPLADNTCRYAQRSASYLLGVRAAACTAPHPSPSPSPSLVCVTSMSLHIQPSRAQPSTIINDAPGGGPWGIPWGCMGCAPYPGGGPCGTPCGIMAGGGPVGTPWRQPVAQWRPLSHATLDRRKTMACISDRTCGGGPCMYGAVTCPGCCACPGMPAIPAMRPMETRLTTCVTKPTRRPAATHTWRRALHIRVRHVGHHARHRAHRRRHGPGHRLSLRHLLRTLFDCPGEDKPVSNAHSQPRRLQAQ
jgi:hypothetical protein